MANIYYKNGSTFTSVLDIVYPVGAIYVSTTNTSPASIVGGTWTAVTGAIRGATSNIGQNTGSDTHTLTVNEMPSHNHDIYGVNLSDTGGDTFSFLYGGRKTAAWRDTYISKVGGGQGHSIVQNSYNVYCWHRTA